MLAVVDERRKFIETLSRCKNVDLLEFQYNLLVNPIESVKEYVNELNAYRLQLNLPSMSPTFTARPFEILACGGVLLQNKVIGEQSNQLFQNWKHLVYYDSDNPEDLIHKIQYLVDHPEVAKEIAAEGHKLCHEKHTLSNRIQTILEWLGIDFEVKRGMNQSVAGFEG